jgi:hypothetical protein
MRHLIALACMLSVIPIASSFAREPLTVVELFTSQGCSSCPPADAFLTDLQRQRSDVLPLAFHVTYWNNLGWTDRYSFQAATMRQSDYARDLGDSDVYTPEMVVAGAHGLVGSDRPAVLAAIAQAKAAQGVEIPLSLARAGTDLLVSVGRAVGQGQLLLIGFDHQHRTAISRGENDGRTVLETNIVRSIQPIGAWNGAARTLHEATPAGEDFAVLLQGPDGHILAAARPDPRG